MIIHFDKKFQQQYKKLPVKIQQQFNQRLKLLITDPQDPRLRLHPLKGNFKNYYSINVTGDIRALFQKNDQLLIFSLIGSHSKLYG